MSQHILLKYATRKPYKSNPEMPDEAVFDLLKGYWIQNNHYLITSKYGKLTTKKCDLETGEDLKGE